MSSTSQRQQRPRWVAPDAVDTMAKRYGTFSEVWLSEIDSRVDELCAQWSLTPSRALSGGFQSAVVLAHDNQGTPVVLKVPLDRGVVEREVSLYEVWTDSHRGVCPEVLASNDTAFVMTYCQPGDMLWNHPTSVSADGVLLGELCRLGETTTVSARQRDVFMSSDHLLEKRCGLVVDRLEALRTSNAAFLHSTASDAATRILGADRIPSLTHGDLHPGNVLRHGDRWVFIDPVGMYGDVEYDVALFSVTRQWGTDAEELLATVEGSGLNLRLLADYAVFHAVDRLVIEHWYHQHDTAIPTLTAAVERLAAR